MRNFKSVGKHTDEAYLHSRIAKTCKHGIVELGVLYGETTKILLDNSSVMVYGVDPLIPDSMNNSLIGSIDKIKQNTKSHCDRFVFINDYSYNVIKGFDNKFDYLFIDGDHNYLAVKKDFEDWFSLLEVGGFVGIHDSAANRGGPYWWDGPSKLADELILDDRVEYIETVFCLTVFKKR